jgi:ComF family protein
MRPVCAACGAKLEELAAEAACLRCGKPVAEEGAPCPWCLGKGLYPFKQVLRLGVHHEPLKTLVKDLKYRGRWTLAGELAGRLLRKERVRELLEGNDALMAVPLHWRKRLARGYNQSDLLARHLAKGCNGVRVIAPVKRVRDTESQTRQTSQSARRENMKGAFKLVDARLVEGKRIVIVDDVTTSGATIQEVARVALVAKPASISAVAVSIADARGRDFTQV